MSNASLARNPTARRLERVWLVWTMLFSLALTASAALLTELTVLTGWLWLVPATAVASFELVILRRLLVDNRLPNGELSDRLGAGTTVTLARGLLIAGLAGFIAAPPDPGLLAWLPGLLYLGVALADRLDGFVARSTGHVTRLGARLDVELDALGLVVAPIYGVMIGRLPPWYLLLGAAYYLFNAGLALRRWRGQPVHESRLRPSAHSRAFAGFQMGMVAAALVPLLPAAVTWLAASLFMLPVLVGFGRDWLVVTGRVSPVSRRYARTMGSLIAASRWVLPVGIRLLLLAAGIWIGVGEASLNVALVLLIGSVVAGIAPRIASLGLILLVGLAPLTPASWLVLAAALVICLLGSGCWSLWTLEEKWLFAPRD